MPSNVLWFINPEQPSFKDLLCKRTFNNEWLSKFKGETCPDTVKSSSLFAVKTVGNEETPNIFLTTEYMLTGQIYFANKSI